MMDGNRVILGSVDMATATMVMKDMHRLFDGGTLAGQGDGQLLEAFVGRRDEAAFAGLVTRHGPMVLGTCRAVLRDPDAAEDVFQATFLVLARKAGSVRGRDALGGWLHRVAFRAAVQANRAAARRRSEERKAAEMRASMATRDDVRDDLRSTIHAEVERLPEALRLPVVLCDLQGRTREQAADELRWTEATVRGRLARGRAKLKARLARAGLAPSVAGLTAAMAREASAVVPEVWVTATARAASASLAGKLAAGAGATAIASGVLKTMRVARLKAAAGVVLAVGVVAGASFGVVAARGGIGKAGPEAPAVAAAPIPPADGPIVYEGRVLGPDGKPFEGATLAIKTNDGPAATPPTARARSGADGRFRLEVARSDFKLPATLNLDDIWRRVPVVASADGYGPDWAALEGYDARPGGGPGLTLRLVESGVPVEGRVLDLQGRPVPGATVRISRIERTSDGGLDAFLRAWKVASSSAESIAWGGGTLFDAPLAGLPAEVRADAGGRFRISGIGKDRAVRLLVSGPSQEETEIRVITRAGVDLKELGKIGPETEMMMNGKPNRSGPVLYGSTFDLLLGPGRSLEGVVREAGTGRPIAGVHVGGGGEGNARHFDARTDKDGRYRLAGLPVAAPIRLNFFPPPGQPFLPAAQKVEPREGATPLSAEIEMTRGVMARGRVVDRDTGKPVVGTIVYQPLAGNTAFRGTPAGEFIDHVMSGNEMEKDGTFQVVVGPGQGAILVQIHRPNAPGLDPDYLPAKREPNDGAPGFGGSQDMLTGAVNQAITLFTYHAYSVVDPKPGDAEVSCELKVVRGRSKGGTILDPEGNPLAGASISGLAGPYEGGSQSLARPEFTVTTLDPARPRYLLASHAARKLAGARVVRGDELEAVDLRLKPWGTVTGRLVDGDGHPIAGAKIGVGYRGEGGAAVPGMGGRSPEERILTDADGKFRVEGLVPGLKAALWATKQGRPYQSGKGMEEIDVRPGESKDLGDVSATPFQ